MNTGIKLIIGLGNPGKKYEHTYHNLGFLAVDFFAERLGVKFKKKECNSVVAQCFSAGVVLAKPQTFMNLSGIAVKGLMKKYGADLSDVIVLYDDIDIERWTIRFRESGSGGSHNGMRSIICNITPMVFDNQGTDIQ